MARRRRNPREIPGWVMQLALFAGGGFVLYKIGRAALDKLKDTVPDVTKPVARAIVGTGDVRYAGGITFTLPGGTVVDAKVTQPLGGALFQYKGLRYKLVAADPPGSGNYKAERA